MGRRGRNRPEDVSADATRAGREAAQSAQADSDGDTDDDSADAGASWAARAQSTQADSDGDDGGECADAGASWEAAQPTQADADADADSGGETQAGGGGGDNQPWQLRWLRGGAPAEVAAALPSPSGEPNLDVLALGREVQPTPRPNNVTISKLVLSDAHLRNSPPQVSGLQGEIYLDKEHSLIFSCKGRSYNFINDQPYNKAGSAASKARLYDGDRIRLGGNADGKEGGGYAKFCLHVDAPALGQRPTPDLAAALPASAPPQAAPPLVAAPATMADPTHQSAARDGSLLSPHDDPSAAERQRAADDSAAPGSVAAAAEPAAAIAASVAAPTLAAAAEPASAEPASTEPAAAFSASLTTSAVAASAEPASAEPTSAEPTSAEPTSAEPAFAEPTAASQRAAAGAIETVLARNHKNGKTHQRSTEAKQRRRREMKASRAKAATEQPLAAVGELAAAGPTDAARDRTLLGRRARNDCSSRRASGCGAR